MRKILLLTDTVAGGTTGGAETHILNLLREIDQNSYSVDVIYFDTDAGDYAARKEIEGINYHRIPIRRVYSLSSFKHLKTIYRMMKEGDYDCVMSFFESSDLVTSILGSLSGIGIRISNRRDTGFRNSKKLTFAYRLINRFFTHFIAVSGAVKESIVEQGVDPQKVRVIYNAVDLKRFEKVNRTDLRQECGITSEEQIFGMVANLNPVKNHSSVITALRYLHGKGKKAHLMLAGKGQLKNELEQQALKLGLERYVHFIGPRTDIEDVIDTFDSFILASHTEGLSNALLEAMASKKAVIASRVGGNVEVVKDGVDGFLVSTEPDSIAEAMEKLFDSEVLRMEMGQNAFEHIERQFTIEKMLNSYMSIFNQAEIDRDLKRPESTAA